MFLRCSKNNICKLKSRYKILGLLYQTFGNPKSVNGMTGVKSVRLFITTYVNNIMYIQKRGLEVNDVERTPFWQIQVHNRITFSNTEAKPCYCDVFHSGV